MATFVPALQDRQCGCTAQQGGCACSKERPARSRRESAAAPAVVVRRPGSPLDKQSQQHLARRFGFDFSAIRIHADAEASESARSLDAAAYTVGRDIVFGRDRFAPETPPGRALLEHEAAHVVQQGFALAPRIQGLGAATSSAEHEAQGRSPRSLTPVVPGTIQRAAP